MRNKNDLNLLRFGGMGSPISGQTSLILPCAADNSNSLCVAVMTPPCQAGLERASWIKRQMFLAGFLYGPISKTVPGCTPEYKTCEWNDDMATNSPAVTNQGKLCVASSRRPGTSKNCIDERRLNSLTVETTLA